VLLLALGAALLVAATFARDWARVHYFSTSI